MNDSVALLWVGGACEVLPRSLNGCQPFHAWQSEVALPASATNEAEVFRRRSIGAVIGTAPKLPGE